MGGNERAGTLPPEAMLERLPEELAEAVRPLLAEPPLSREGLAGLVEDLESTYRDPGDVPRSADLDTGLSLVDECRDLLRRLDAEDTPARRRVVQAALRYLAAETDLDDDMESVTGFDDDEQVLAAARRYLDRGVG